MREKSVKLQQLFISPDQQKMNTDIALIVV